MVNKCIDPQRKTAGDLDKISDNGQNPAMIALKRGIASDRRTLDNTASAANAATHSTLNKDGDPVTVTADKDAKKALDEIMGETLSDGMDLVQTAACALLEQAADHADGPGWLDKPYTVRRLSRKVYIKETDSAAYRDDTTTPAQEVFRAVRRAIQQSRAVQTDPRNGYTYIEDVTPDGIDSILYRMDKYADIGGTDCNGLYTADKETLSRYTEVVKLLSLTDRQAQIVRLRMQGYGTKAIAAYLGVQKGTIDKQLSRLREKCEKFGFTPDMWEEMTGNND